MLHRLAPAAQRRATALSAEQAVASARMILASAIGHAVISGVWEQWRPLLAGVLAAAGLAALFVNLRDIRRR